MFFVSYNEDIYLVAEVGMQLFMGADHGGFNLKQDLLLQLKEAHFEVKDFGSFSQNLEDDYPDSAIQVAEAVVQNTDSLGILLCRSGEGMAMTANKIKGIRAAVAWEKEIAQETRKDNDANVLVLPADFISKEQAWEIVQAFVSTPFSGEERHQRRLAKMSSLENRG